MPARIEFSESIPSYPDARLMFEDILQKMFPEHSRILVEEEFVGDSFSGSWVFLVQRFRGGRPELPVVVKIASVSLIEREWQAYNKYIRDKWPRTAPIRDKPVLASDGALSGLYYDVAGEGLSSIESTRSYCLKESTIVEDVQEVLDDFAKEMDYVIDQYGDKEFRIYLRAIYDPVLPVNLLIEPASLSPGVEPTVVTTRELPVSPLKPGTYVRLEDFVITKVDLKRHTITLNLPRLPDQLPDNSYCVRLKFESREEMPAYTFGQDMPVVEGLVVRTRYSQWQDEMAKVLADQTFDLDSKTFSRPDGAELTNPFVAVQRILRKRRNIMVGPIHGDMNLGNILVDTNVHKICLIDFAEARRDHVLHDFLRLETEVVTKLIPPALVEASLPVEETICGFYEQLHYATFDNNQNTQVESLDPALDRAFAILKIVRQVARDQGLYKQNDYAEYYDCLTLYLLGALKFGNLDRIPETPAPLPKQAAFWAAASVQDLPEQPPTGKGKEGIEKEDLSNHRHKPVILALGITTTVASIIAAIFGYIILSNAKAPLPVEIALKSFHNRYATALGEDDGWLLKQELDLSDCGWFSPHHLDSGKVALMTCYGRYITAPESGTTRADWMLRQESKPGRCGAFVLHNLGRDGFALETCAGNFLTAGDQGLGWEGKLAWSIVGEQDTIKEWERFKLMSRYIPPLSVITDFDSCDEPTKRGREMGTAHDPESSDTIVLSYGHEEGGGCIAKLEYDMERWSGFWIRLGDADLSPYSQLVFDIKADSRENAPERVKIELKRANRDGGQDISILNIPGVTTDWRTKRVKLGDFEGSLPSLTDVEELVFVFEANGTRKTGAIYLDNITLR